ncbi:hypothetical protein K440DRAFT_642427 [Wilcoxina mikolae CBS 423.85]|nr:hypothetical protein K440DRAFT_642427 [Wilcoxina mikolae CBS 423.85]
MPEFNGVTVRICTAERGELPEFTGEVEEKRDFPVKTVYIEAVSNQTFWVSCSFKSDGDNAEIRRDVVYRVEANFDGKHLNTTWSSSGLEIRGQWIRLPSGASELRYFCFKEIAFMEGREEGQIEKDAIASIGEIRVPIRRITRTKVKKTYEYWAEQDKTDEYDSNDIEGDSPVNTSDNNSDPGPGTEVVETHICEKDVKGRDISAIVGFGKRVSYLPPPRPYNPSQHKRRKVIDYSKRVKTVREYTTEDWDYLDSWEKPLQSRGLIPRTPERTPSPIKLTMMLRFAYEAPHHIGSNTEESVGIKLHTKPNGRWVVVVGCAMDFND